MIHFSPAKINLGLYVTHKRADGYHHLESLFLPIKLYDAIELIEADENQLFIHCNKIPGDQSKNSCILTLKLMQELYDCKNYQIHLLKTNPIGAGLGAGSANAAAVILLLNQLEHLNLSVEKMREIALQIGSDNAFFIEEEAKYVSGRGEEIQPCQLNLSGHQVILILPNIHQSTKEAYSSVDFIKPTIQLNSLTATDIISQEVKPKNSFQQSFINRNKETQKIIEEIKESGAYYSSLSGSGSSFYGLFLPKQKIPIALKQFANKFGYTYLETEIL